MHAERLSTTPTSTIPWLDMQTFIQGSPQERLDAAMAFGDSFRKIGFLALSNIGINKTTLDNAYATIEEYFKKDEAYKMLTRTPEGVVGFGTEHAKYTDVMDLKEFFQTTGLNHPAHLWPDLPKFKESMLALYAELENCAHTLLQATAIYLGYNTPAEKNILSNMLGTNNAVMRIIHYPPVPAQIPPGSIRAAEHEDLCILTIIPRPTGPGLQVKTGNNEWMEVVVPENSAVINAGDTLEIITNGIIPSTTHRVVNPNDGNNKSRYSIPFFGNLIPSTPLDILDKCRSEPAKYPEYNAMTFDAFMKKRYADLGLSLK